ncbi:GAF domain-containing sensor histidine kinase (plasmid) [Paracoccus liaowanqingii]|uniref:histidine kinase n=1 Tax=Paracoccus liaowanqingii TaxID=2560053 RepID=A0A4Y5SSC9_9RHOB|nr:GAF domain-containing sensor histidine kinase [Paracoccus liaowanqingii]QDA36402.1 GAF domain-containing sensor histidine kinase [Paracoccus liaowanqingii]
MPTSDPFPAEDPLLATDLAVITGNPAVPTMLETVCLAAGVRFAAIGRVTDKHWTMCSVKDQLDLGLAPGDQLVVESTLCHQVRTCATEIIVNDIRQHEVYRDHQIPRRYGFRSYLSMPIRRPDGTFFGTLCAFDPEPRNLDDQSILQMVRLFAKLIGDTLHTEDQMRLMRHELDQERRMAQVQEEFMAILAHDLRNPANAIRAGLRMLARRNADPETASLISLMDAAAQRMTDLVANLLDHARNRLSDGIVLDRTRDGSLAEALQQVIAEFRTISWGQEIRARIDLPGPIDCDRARLAQMLSNLIGNAITHGAPGRPIGVVARTSDGMLVLTVENEGRPIPPDQIPGLFKPFKKTGDHPSQKGLGLGLYIAAEIAAAHGGRMQVASDADRTIFTFTMPLDAA